MMGAASAGTGPVTAGVPDDLAGHYGACGRLAEAEPLFKRAVAINGRVCRRTVRTKR